MPDHVLLAAGDLQSLIDALRNRGYRVLGPTRGPGAVTLGDVAGIDDLPRGVGDEQEAAHYRLRDRGDELFFGFATTVQSAKAALFPPDELLWRGVSDGTGFTVERNRAVGAMTSGGEAPTGDDASTTDPAVVDRSAASADPAARPVAILGLRGCDLAAIGIQDHILLGRSAIDAHYAVRRADAFLVAVACGSPAATCFCASMGTGPAPGPGADLTMTELLDPHRFLVEAGTTLGAEVLAQLPTTPANPNDLDAAAAVLEHATAAMGRQLRTDDLRDLLYASAESPRWNDVAARCLACTNCTSVCPTCFCTTISDVTDLAGRNGERHRVWDSCFSMEYSNLHGGAVRSSTASRYRQWLTHKLAAWTDQFGMSGCVGCGRCITWCPAGIDLTVEVAALRELAEAHGAVAAGVTSSRAGAEAPPR